MAMKVIFWQFTMQPVILEQCYNNVKFQQSINQSIHFTQPKACKEIRDDGADMTRCLNQNKTDVFRCNVQTTFFL